MKLPLILFLALAGAQLVRAAEELVLAPHLTDNMVVRRSTKFYGLAPAKERVRIQIKGKSDYVARVDAAGKWQRDVPFSPSPKPIEVEIYLGNSKTPARVLTNLVVGEILVAGIADGQGIPAEPRRASSAIRFIKLDSLDPAEPAPGAPRWREADAQGLAAANCDLLAFEQALALSRNGAVVGIVQVPEAMFAACVPIGAGTFPEDLKARLENVKNAVDSAILRRASEVRANKRMGRIAVVPPINNYEKHLIYSPGQFRTKTDIPVWLDFDSALGPQESRY